MERLSLYAEHSPPDKRTRFSPEFDRFYSVYACDFTKYNKLCKMLSTRDFEDLNLYSDIDPYEFKKLRKFDNDKLKKFCYIRDEDGKLKHLGDQRHIFRINVLKTLRASLAGRCFDVLFQPQTEETSIVCDFGDYTYYEERYTTETYIYHGTRYKGQEFITKDIQLNWLVDADIKTQVTAYIRVLRLCKKGISLDEAIKQIKERK